MPVKGVRVALKCVEHAHLNACRSGGGACQHPVVEQMEVAGGPEVPGLLPLAQ